MENIRKVLSIRIKKYVEANLDYLTEAELLKIFESIDATRKNGYRDLLLLSLLYGTGGRASEIINIKTFDINLESKYIILSEKVIKEDVYQLWKIQRNY